MADSVDIMLWIDRRWKAAIEKHLKDKTLQEHLEDVLDDLCDQLPRQEYDRISREIWQEDLAARQAEEAARTYAAYHVTENGREWYFKTTPGEELLTAAQKLRIYTMCRNGTAPNLFIKMFADGRPITAEEYDELIALRMENTGKVTGAFDISFDKQEFSAVNITATDRGRTAAGRYAFRYHSSAVSHEPHFPSRRIDLAHHAAYRLQAPQTITGEAYGHGPQEGRPRGSTAAGANDIMNPLRLPKFFFRFYRLCGMLKMR